MGSNVRGRLVTRHFRVTFTTPLLGVQVAGHYSLRLVLVVTAGLEPVGFHPGVQTGVFTRHGIQMLIYPLLNIDGGEETMLWPPALPLEWPNQFDILCRVP